MNLLAALAKHLNGKSGPNLVLEATQIGSQMLCVQHGFRRQIEHATDVIADGAAIPDVEIEPHTFLLIRSSTPPDIIALRRRFDLNQLAPGQ